jgi:hypothetical protein
VDQWVASALAFFNKSPQFIDLGLGHMQIMNDGLTHLGRMVTGQIDPVQKGVVRMMRSPLNRPKTIALHQPGQSIRDHLVIAAQRLKKGALIRTESSPTGRTVVTLFAIAKDFDVTGLNSTKRATGGIVTPVLFKVHSVSPPDITHDTPNGFHGLGSHYLNFTA